MGQALSRGKASTFPPLLVETQIFTLWTIQDVRELQKLVRNTINGYWVVEIQFESLLQNFKNVTDYITLEKLFAVLDNDFDGRIDCLELIGGIALVCSATFEEKVKFCFEYYDFNYNGTLSSKEMVIMMILSVCGLNVLAGGNEENEPDIAVFERLAEDAFNRADRDRSNQISYNEFVSWARSNRELMAGLEGLQQVTREARSRIEDEDSASEISEGECYHENEMTPETSAIHDQPLPPPVSTIQYPDKWRKQIHEPTKCFTKNSMDEGYTNLRLTTAVGVSAAALYIKSDHSISNEDAASSYIAYPSATLVILQNTSTYEQSFYCKHTSQVVCLSSCSKGITFASADTLGDIHIWQPWSLVQTQRVIHSPQKLSRVCISPAADAVIVVGRDFDNTLTLYDIRSGDMSGTAKGIPSPGQTHDLCFSPSGSELVVVGTKYILFLTIAKNGSLEKSNGRIGKLGKQQTFFSAAYISAFEAAVGCSNGDVYLFKDFTCCQVVQAHSNKSAVLSLLYNTLQNILVSGGSDGVVKTWDSTLQPVGDAVDVTDLDDDAHLPKGSEIISLSARDGAILVTTKGHDILEIIFATSKATHSIKRLLHGHSDGIYGLTCHPLCDDFITTSDDKTLRLWRLNGDSCIMVSFRATPERAHAVCYSPTGDTLCVGMVDGSVALLDASLRVFCKWKHTRATITDVIFSAIGKVLIMGAADGNIYVYLAEDKKSFVRHTICRGHGSPVLSVDVSMHSNFIMANYADGSLQYWDSNGILIVDSYPLCDMKWYGNHTIFGWSTQGLWSSDSSSRTITCCHKAPQLRVAVASRGPDILLVRYPCINENALCKVYPGHSETVRSMRFTFNRRNLISIGGSDNSIFIWNHSLEDEQASDDDDEVDDTPEPSILKLSPHVSHIMPPQRPVFSAPTDATTFTSATDVDLDLSWIHGFQGADRNNVMINTDGALVYPAAAVVVSYSKSTGKQRFLHGIHKNAITCLCIHPSGHIFASGEKGDVSPLVIVWGDKDMDILWRWESLHKGGVGQVAFNPRGDLLAALGCDATVSISNWSQGVVLLHVPCNYGVSCMHFLPPEEPSSTHDILAFGGSFCMKFWEVKGRQYSTQRGLWKHSHHCTVTAIASLVPGICVTGTLSGQLLLWNKHRVILDITNPLQAVQASIYPHKGAIYALCATFGRLVNDGISTELDISIKKVADNVRPPSLFSSDSHGNIALWHLVSEPDIIRTISHSSTQGALSKDAYGSSYTLRLMKTFNISILDPKPLDVCIHSLARNEQRLYVSTRGGDMYEIASDSIATSVSPVTSLLSSRILSVHGGSGELTGLATHPLLPVYFTSGDDRLLRCWSLTTHELISCLRLKFISKSIAISPDGRELAYGCADGSVSILDVMAFVNPGNKANCLVDKDLHGVSIEFGNEENTRTCVWYKREPVVRSVSVKAIQAVAYSFDGALLAIASHDNVIYLHDARNEYKRLGKCLGLDSVGMHIDFGVLALPQDAASASYNSDTKKVTRKFLKEGTTDVFEDRLGDLTLADLCIKVVSASYELGLWRCKAVPAIQLNGEAKEIAKDKNQLNDGWAAEEIYEPATRDAWWATVSGPLGWSMDGAWRDEEGVLTSVDRCHSWRQVSALATTDSAGMVRLYNYPCASSGATDKVYCGHAGSLARGGWSCDDAFFLTIGAIDRCIFVWRSDILDEIRERNARNDPPSTADNPSLPQSDYESALVLKAPHGGDESSAVKPWKAAAREPSNWKQTLEIGCLPDVSLELKFAYGYRGYDCRNNIGVSTIATGEVIIYHTAAIGVVYNSRAHKQVHNLEHDDDIISIAVHPSEAIVATGETGKKPKLVVWSAQTGLTIKVICFHSRGISNVCFDSAGSLLISCGLDDDRLVAVHNWRTGVLVGTGKCGKGIGVHCLSATDGGFVTGGKNHFKFWDLSIGSSGAKQVPSKSGAFHKGVDCRTVVSIACSASDTFTGMSDGVLAVWKNRVNTSYTKAHVGPVTAMCVLSSFGGTSTSLKEDVSSRLVSAGKDGLIIVWTLKLDKEWTLDMTKSTPLSSRPEISAVASAGNRIVIGTVASEIFEVDLAMGQLNRLAQCHFEARGEANALAATPDSVVFASGGDDCTVRIWDGGSFRQKAMCSVSSKVRALAFQTDGSQLAVGCYEGRVKVFSTNLQDQIADVAISSAWIQAMRYSPDGQTLAVGSHDCRVYLLNAVAYCIRHVCIGHHSFITALDFSADSNKLQSASGDYELLFWSSADGKQIKRMAEVCDVKWATWTSSIGWPVQGIFPPDTDGTDVNSVSASPDGRLLVTGDDFRRVKLFRYPVPIQGAKFKEYKGHSEHVTNVVFLGDSGVVSIGGLDKSILQFEIKKK